MVPKSSSNPHALSMGKAFTDIAWMEATYTGYFIDFRHDANKITGAHFNERYELPNLDKGKTDGFKFAHLVHKIGGKVPESPPPPDQWLTIQTGYEQAAPSRAGLVLQSSASPQPVALASNGGTIPTAQPLVAPKGKTVLNLGNMKQRVPG